MIRVVLVTIPQDKAKELANKILENRLCACVNIIKSVDSFFWWENRIDYAKESILIIKTKNNLFNKLKKFIKDNHPYTVPEIISWKIDLVNKEYKDWVINETSKK